MATAPRPLSRRLARLALLASCAVVVGCGGDDGDGDQGASDTEQIKLAVERVMESEKIADQCEAGVSARFVREVYVTLAQCRTANRPDPGDAPPDTAQIAATRIDGAKATTGVTLTSVKGARATGRVALVRVGTTWKVDRLGVDFLRSVFGTLPAEADSADERRILRCLAEGTRALSDREVRRVGNLIVGQRLQPDTLPAGVVRCIRAGAPQSDQATTA